MGGAELRALCLGLVGAVEEFPFSEGVSVFKVGGKIFALSALDEAPLEVSLKCEPELAAQLRADYDAIVPGYHLNKKHWLTITLGADAEDGLVAGLIEDSYALGRAEAQGLAPSGASATAARAAGPRPRTPRAPLASRRNARGPIRVPSPRIGPIAELRVGPPRARGPFRVSEPRIGPLASPRRDRRRRRGCEISPPARRS